ncbi:hypothetical protein MTP99_004551 [Tenebrio molitor]|nr:hypothetical protein MTP99_004551 [Tenebrio molitor]
MMKVCREENGLTIEDVKLLRDVDLISQDKKCYIKCMYEKAGFIQSDGTILVEKMKRDGLAHGDKETVDKVYECISKVSNVSTCDKMKNRDFVVKNLK